MPTRYGVFALQNLNEAVIVVDAAGIVTYWNDAATELFGWSAAERQGKLLTAPFPIATQEDFAQHIRDIVAGKEWNGEFEGICKEGRRIWIQSRLLAMRDASGKVTGVFGTYRDISDWKKTEQALIAHNRVMEQIASGTPLNRILESVVELVEEQLSGCLCSILRVEGGRLRFAAAPNLPAAYNIAVDGVPIGPASGSCGTAAFLRKTVVVNDIATDPLWANYRKVALAHGLRSCVSVPIFASGEIAGREHGEVIGTFAIYRRDLEPVDPQVYRILEGVPNPERNDKPDGKRTSPIARAAFLAGVAIERTEAERAFRESDERFRNVLDSSPAVMFLKDFEGRFLFVNHTTANQFEVAQSEWIGKTCRDVMPPQIAEQCERIDRRVTEKLAHVQTEISCKWHGGHDIHFLATNFPLFHQDGRPYAICSILTDITELVDTQREFYRLWSHAPDPLCVIGFDGYFKQLNPAWIQRLGWSDLDLLRQPFLEFVHPDDRSRTASMGRQLASGTTIRGFENRCRCRDGTYRWFSWNAIPIMDSRTIYGIARDVTEEKRLADQVRQAQKMEAIGQLASGIAHDFNNLLTVINGYCDLLIEGSAYTDERRDVLTQVRGAGQRAAELTAQLLAFSRKAIVEPKVLNLNQVVESSARMLRRVIGEDVHLITNLIPIPQVKIDPGQLEQVFVNMAVNARDAMPTGGRLTIATDTLDLPEGAPTASSELRPGLYVRVSLTDTGTGMPPSVLAHMFEPFFTTKGVGKGTGLGLATVYGIIRQAGGLITVESEVGKGTTFRILLPVEYEVAPDVVITGREVALRGTETVLLAEDEDGVREVARLALTMQGYRVLEAATGTEALKVESSHDGPIHILVTDVVMPDLGGRALADILRGKRPNMRVLYMSGYTDDAVIRHGVEASADHLVQKPFTAISLVSRIREVLDDIPHQGH